MPIPNFSLRSNSGQLPPNRPLKFRKLFYWVRTNVNAKKYGNQNVTSRVVLMLLTTTPAAHTSFKFISRHQELTILASRTGKFLAEANCTYSLLLGSLGPFQYFEIYLQTQDKEQKYKILFGF